MFFNLFGDDGDKIYEYIYDKYPNPYILQQRALFLNKLERYGEAFHYIDMAHNFLPNNLSIKNSQAIITFCANKGRHTDLALLKMKEAMHTLEKCYRNDQCKNYHALKYAEFALILHNNYKISDYLNQAKKFISDIDLPLKSAKNIKRALNDI